MSWSKEVKEHSKLKISDPAPCSYSGGASGVEGLTCGLELELKLSDRTGVQKVVPPADPQL